MRRALCSAALLALAPLPAAAQALLHSLFSPSAEIEGEFGRDVSEVPDVDGDGVSDLLVGASQEDPGASPSDAGRAHLFSGATGSLLRTLRSPDEQLFGYFGYAVVGVPDLDSDGRGDLLVGAWAEAHSGVNDAGRAYVFSGATGALLHTLVPPDVQDRGYFGRDVAGVGDVDGDGRGDLLVGMPSRFLSTDEGRAYVFSGATGALLHTLTSPYAAANDHFGEAVSGAPDVDGDGVSDLLIGAYKDDPGLSPSDAGRAYVFSGASGALLHELISPNEEFDGRFGVAVSGVTDVNGDERGDLFVGANFEGPGIFGHGRAYLFSGADGELLHTLVSPNSYEQGQFGLAVSGVPDTDGDGRGDLLVGAFGEAVGAGPERTGRAYLFSGASGGLLHTLEPPGAPTFGFGWSVSGVHDLNGDGRGDLLVGSPLVGTGRAYVFSSPAGEAYELTATVAPGSVTYGEEFSVTITVSNNTVAPVSADLWLVTTRAGVPGAYTEYVGARSVPANGTATRVIEHTVPRSHGGYTITPGAYTVTVNAGDFAANTILASDTYDLTVTATGHAADRAGVLAAPTRDATASVTPPSEVLVRPNPASGRAALAFALDVPAAVRLALYDVLGRKVAAVKAGTLEPGAHRLALDVSALPAGVYVWRLVAGEHVESGRLTVAR